MFRRRLRLLVGGLLLVGAVLLARLWEVQVLWHDRFDPEVYTRAGGSHLVETLRGGVYACHGTPLAKQVPSFALGVHYAALSDELWKDAVLSLCEASREELTGRAQDIISRVERVEAYVRKHSGRDDIRVAERYQYHCVVEDLPAETAAIIRTEPRCLPTVRVGRNTMPAVCVLERTRRVYPNGPLAPHVVGLLQAISPKQWAELVEQGRAWTADEPLSEMGQRYRMDDQIGTLGVEKSCEDMLRGRRGYMENRYEFGVLTVRRTSRPTRPEAGLDVYLTLREDFQAAANEALRRAAEDPDQAGLEFTKGALAIVDVRDGAVLAAATYPTYDLSTYRQDFKRLSLDGRSPLLFRPAQAVLPPGSVFKVITAAAALGEGGIVPEATFTCEHREVFESGGVVRSFHCTGQHGPVSLLTAMEESCNIYFYHAGLAAGGEALARCARAFGLGAPTSVDVPYEREGKVPEPRSTFGVVNVAIGQGDVLCTPLQIANMMAAVANGGKLYKLHVVDCARDSAGDVVFRYEPQATEVPVSKPTLEVLRRGLRLVVESGTAAATGLDRFQVAGKTGTAELGANQPYHAWFAGYAPHDNPKIAFAVVSERTAGHGGSHAAPIMALALEPIWDSVQAMP